MICCSSENFGEGPAMPDGSRVPWSFGRLLDWHFVHGMRRSDVRKLRTAKTPLAWASGPSDIGCEMNTCRKVL
jgi:hypothetical protein